MDGKGDNHWEDSDRISHHYILIILREVHEHLGSLRDHNVKIKRWPPASKTDTAASGP